MLQCVLPNKKANLTMKAYSKHKVYLMYIVHNEIYLVYLMYMSSFLWKSVEFHGHLSLFSEKSCAASCEMYFGCLQIVCGAFAGHQ